MISLDKVLEAARNSSTKSYLVDEISFADGYSEPGYSGEKIALANWNNISVYNKETNSFDVKDNTMPRLANILEKMGYSLEWSDEWAICNCCGKAVRTQADSYSWTASFIIDNGELLCHECIDPQEFLESLEGDHHRANTIDHIDPANYGYVKQSERYENGWYPGQTDNPAEIAKQLREKGHERFLFGIDSVGQFDVRFNVYIHESELST